MIPEAADIPVFQQHLLAAHKAGRAAIKAARGALPVGVSLTMTDDQAVGPNSLRDVKRAEFYGAWLEAARGDDFLGVQNYGRSQWNDRGSLPAPKGPALNGMGQEIYAPSLAGAVRYLGQPGDARLGGMALFSMAFGMGTPLLAVGLSAGTLLPKSGPWMEAVKKAFGVILLASAVWTVSPVIPVVVQMLAWALLLIIPAIYLHALDPLPAHAKGWQRFWKGIGIVMLITGAAMLVGALAGARDPLQPLSGLRGGAQSSEISRLPFERIHSITELDARIQSSAKPVMLDFYADWCVSCKELERFTFSDIRVQQKLAGWTLLQADVTANTEEDKALLARFKLFGPPGIIFFDASGKEDMGVRVIGFQDADEFLATLSRSR